MICSNFLMDVLSALLLMICYNGRMHVSLSLESRAYRRQFQKYILERWFLGTVVLQFLSGNFTHEAFVSCSGF